MSDFSAVGFKLESAEEFRVLLETLLARAKRLPSFIGGEYACYQDASGSALWIQVSPDGQIVGGHPFYEGESNYALDVHRVYEDEEGTPLDGQVYGVIKAGCGCPLVFDSPNLWSSPLVEKECPFSALIRVCAFPKDVSVCKTLEEFQASPSGSLCAEGAIIPSGTFKPGGDKIDPPKPWAIIAGRIKKVQCKQNGFSGMKFYALLVDTLGGSIDVPIALEAVKERPIINGYIGGSFLVSGRYLGTID